MTELKGYFITLEGPDGCGKTTQAHMLWKYLHSRGWDAVGVREPGGTGIGEEIRDVLHCAGNTDMHPNTEILLYSASRAQLVHHTLIPHLTRSADAIVICDRFYDSTFAYQGYGRGLNLEVLRQITTFATGGLVPNLTIYLDIDVEDGISRRKNAAKDGGEWNRMDTQKIEFYEKVRKGYHALIRKEPLRWVTFDATQNVDTLHENIINFVEQRMYWDQKTND